jgi:bifunctional UDP-N-acetylglucosamine pyrophosphorylase/glucosamine-1-phosphate N-acetyltransferase
MMIIPAAGTGSRLGGALPKVLVPVGGRPMLDHLLSLYAAPVSRFVVVVSPAARDLVDRFLSSRRETVEVVLQAQPTGMLDAVLAAGDLVRKHQPDRIWITWCDQIAVHRRTVANLIGAESAPFEPDLALPTLWGTSPYIHFSRDAEGRIVDVLQRREGDAMPSIGESDAGLFSLSHAAYMRDLQAYAAIPHAGGLTRERNFLPFIPWLAARRHVVTFPCVDPVEAVGINTPEELRCIEDVLRATAAGGCEPDPK